MSEYTIQAGEVYIETPDELIKSFLNAGTKDLGIDCSILVSFISEAYALGKKDGCSEAKSLGRSETLKEVKEKIENMAIETVGNSAKTVEQILNLLTK